MRYLLRDSAPIAEAKEQMRKYNKMAKKTADKAKKKKEKSPVEVSLWYQINIKKRVYITRVGSEHSVVVDSHMYTDT